MMLDKVMLLPSPPIVAGMLPARVASAPPVFCGAGKGAVWSAVDAVAMVLCFQARV